MNVYSSFIYNCLKLETTKMSFNGWMVKQTVVHPHRGILLLSNKENHWYTQWPGESPENYVEWRKPIQTDYTLYESINITFF